MKSVRDILQHEKPILFALKMFWNAYSREKNGLWNFLWLRLLF